MKKKLYFLTCLVLVLALSGAVHAGGDLPVENYSFEEDVNGEQITEGTWIGNVNDWGIHDTTGWANGWNFASDGFGSVLNYEAADGNVSYFAITWHDANDVNNICEIYQILDSNTDGNVVIAANRRYTLTFNALSCSDIETPIAYGALYYPSGPSPNGVNDVILAQRSQVLTAPTWDEEGYDGWEELKTTYIALPGAGSLGKKLCVKLSAPLPWYSGTWVAFDNVRVDWDYLHNAWDPRPENGATYVSADVNLVWNPGLWADDVNGHEVYFGSTWAEVNSATTASSEYKGTQSPNSYDPTPGGGDLILGETYYWRIDEVCEPGSSPPVPPGANGRWKGDVWSFTIEGHARDPFPFDGSKNIERNVTLRWKAGAKSKYHDIYFGSTDAEVASATTASSEYKGRTNLGTELYATASLNLQVTERYHWRIDEVNTMTVKGYIWDFKVIDYILVDDFDFYSNHFAMRTVWKDSLVGLAGVGEVWLNKDEDYAVDGNSMLFKYWNTSSPYWSETTRTYSPAQDWSYAGNRVAAMELSWLGDVDNGPDPPLYVKLSDGSATAQINPGPNDVTDPNMHSWLIPLKDFNDGGVNLSSITKITLGIGDGAKEAGPPDEIGTLYFDEIRLYPPRCMPEMYGDANYHAVGDFTTAHHMGADCITDCEDLMLMAERDWLLTDSYLPTQPPDTNGLIYFKFNEGSGTTVANNGTLGSAFDGWLSSVAEEQPDWTTDAYEGWALDFDPTVGKSDDADHVRFPGDLNLPNDTNHFTMTCWMKLENYPGEWDFPVLIESRSAASDATGLGLCQYGYLCYWWNNDYWDWWSDIWPDVNVWTFVAVTIAPDEAKLYYSEYGSGAITIATNVADHNNLEKGFKDGYTNSIGDNSINEGGGWDGMIDDVRIYDETLTEEEIMALAEANWVPLEDYRADIDGDQSVDFTDFSILADHWLERQLWPKP